MHPPGDTIAAVATAPGRGGVGVVRISGRGARELGRIITGKELKPRHAHFTDFLDENHQPLDQGLALFFAAPASFTGEDVLELQGHGGNAVMHLLLQRCLGLGARLAEPGEFTRRAFLNGKLDLAQAESVADIIEAATAEAARGAVRSLHGEFSRAVNDMKDRLINLRMLVEATLDFPEEEIDFLQSADAAGQLAGIRASLDQVRQAARQGSLLREGIHVVLVGRPNVGKSSLLNQLSGEEVAIVTPIAGTTRDAIRQKIEIEGVPLHVVDTAGLRETDDPVERMGIARTWDAIEKANVALVLMDLSAGETTEDQAILDRLPASVPRLRVYNKIDLAGRAPGREKRDDGEAIYLSARTGAGMDLLRRALLEQAGWQPGGEGVFTARARHLDALDRAGRHLVRVPGDWKCLELAAEELRQAQQALSDITGEFSADDLLGEIFSRFCIGK
jgi:tRNA modification GTPase